MVLLNQIIYTPDQLKWNTRSNCSLIIGKWWIQLNNKRQTEVSKRYYWVQCFAKRQTGCGYQIYMFGDLKNYTKKKQMPKPKTWMKHSNKMAIELRIVHNKIKQKKETFHGEKNSSKIRKAIKWKETCMLFVHFCYKRSGHIISFIEKIEWIKPIEKFFFRFCSHICHILVILIDEWTNE